MRRKPGGGWFWGRSFGLPGLFGAVVATWLAGLGTANVAPADERPPGAVAVRREFFGVTRDGAPLEVACEAAFDWRAEGERTRVLITGDVSGDRELAAALRRAWGRIVARTDLSADIAERLDRRFALACIASPTGEREGADSNAGGARPAPKFPPPGPYYGATEHAEAHYLWRWIGVAAPDLVVEVRRREATRWTIPADADLAPRGEPPTRDWGGELARQLDAVRGELLATELPSALGRTAPADVGVIPALRLETPLDAVEANLLRLVAALDATPRFGPSAARREVQRRAARRPLDVLRQFAAHYGQALSAVEYIPATAVAGRLRLGELTGDPAPRRDVLRIVAPYLSGEKSSTPKSGSGQSGHLLFRELARGAEGEELANCVRLVRVAADQGFGPDGRPLEAMPFHLEMSDAFFMGGPILAAAGRLTGEARYYEACHRHLTFMKRTDLRPDGLYRHSPLDESAWGRGNGFVALGLTLALSDWPEDRPERREWIETAAAHLRALARRQAPSGCWHQVIDHPESYAELSSTCMIAFAMARGVRGGWLDRAEFEPHVRAAWEAIKRRTSADGRLIDVCTGTGKQKSLREYYDREALLGRDPRGGAMAMLVAAELVEFLDRP